MEERNKSGLDLIYQAVLLDHNYNATLPPESPTRSIPTPNTPSQLNGVSGSSMYSPGSGKSASRRLRTVFHHCRSYVFQGDRFQLPIRFLRRRVYRRCRRWRATATRSGCKTTTPPPTSATAPTANRTPRARRRTRRRRRRPSITKTSSAITSHGAFGT